MTTAAEMREKRKASKEARKVLREVVGARKVETPGALPRRTVQSAVQAANLPVQLIDPNPWQPRQDFPAEEIKAFAEAIAGQSQLHPIAVRLAPGHSQSKPRYEVGDGERRLRAVKLLGWTTIRAEIGEHTDAQMREMALATALQRKDLNAIEEARAFRAMIAAGDAAGPTELAKQLGLSQGQVSNRLRLLELPGAWQKRVISQEIPATHARSIVRYVAYPAVLAEIDQDVKNQVKWEGGIGTVKNFDDLVDTAAEKVSKPIDGKEEWSHKRGRRIRAFTPTAEQRAQLQLVEIPMSQDKSVTRALNVKLWEKLQAEHETTLAKKAEKKGSTARGLATFRKPEKPLTEAQKKRLAEDEARKEKERARLLARGLWCVAVDWRRVLIAKACRERQVSPQDALRFAVYFAAEHRTCEQAGSIRERGNTLGNSLRPAGATVKKERDSYSPAIEVFEALATTPDQKLPEAVLDFFAELFWSADGPSQAIPDADVLAIADQLAIDLTAEWKKNAAGELTERWLSLYSKEALGKMAGETGIPTRAGTKATLVEGMVKHKHKLKPPAELLKPKKR